MDILKQRIPPHIYEKLVEGNLDSIQSIFTKTEVAIQQLTKLNFNEVVLVLQEAAAIIINDKFKSALDVPKWVRLSTGCEAIDSVTRGGIPVNGITEIVGASGVGKTQLCLQLTLTVQFPTSSGGLNKGAVYICTEDVFPSKRLRQLVQTLPLRFCQITDQKFEENIFIEHISDYEQLRRCLSLRLPQLFTHRNIGLIIIDSIAGIFRSENVGVNYTNRSQEFIELASYLNKFGSNYQIATVIVNQVTENVETGRTEPCLGLAWSNLVTCRFNISRLLDTIRLFEVICAPDLPCSSSKFLIKNDGLTGIDK